MSNTEQKEKSILHQTATTIIWTVFQINDKRQASTSL